MEINNVCDLDLIVCGTLLEETIKEISKNNTDNRLDYLIYKFNELNKEIYCEMIIRTNDKIDKLKQVIGDKNEEI